MEVNLPISRFRDSQFDLWKFVITTRPRIAKTTVCYFFSAWGECQLFHDTYEDSGRG